MCGIVGYIGDKQAQGILISGLKRLEYRGYDSAGVAVLSRGKVYVRKAKGKIRDLELMIRKHKLPAGTAGIAHTRWATHGAPNHVNSHPHMSCDKKIAVVHNGIIENYLPLKQKLKEKGHRFTSQTDTEVLAHLIEAHYKGDLKEAVIKTLRQVRGSFALGVMTMDEPDKVVCARKDSPLIVAHGEEGYFIASDVPAILEHARRVVYLKDNEVAVLTKDRLSLFDLSGRRLTPRFDRIAMDAQSAEKGGYPHFMLKEIHEQPRVLRKLLSAGCAEIQRTQFPKNIRNIIVVACGTAYHAGMVGKYVIESLARLPVWVDHSSEFRYRGPIVDKNSLVIAVSQSGETADTLAAVREAKKHGAKTLAICNVVGSSLTRESDKVLYTLAGPEIGVASTKAYTAQLGVFYLLGLELARRRKTLSLKDYKAALRALGRIPALQEKILGSQKTIQAVAKRHHHFGSFLFLGRNINFPSALEGALKLKEISYIPAEGYAAGEMKHGPIALIDEYRAVVCVAVSSPIYEKMISNIQEIKSRGGRLIVIATEGDKQIRTHAREVVFLPKVDEFYSPLLVALPLQMLAYFISVARGCNVDQPRNLAKSVTVE